MSTGTAPETDSIAERKVIDIPSALGVALGAVVVFVGSLVLFAASPTVSVGPLFPVTSVESVSVIANMAVGASIIVAGAATAIPRLDDLL